MSAAPGYLRGLVITLLGVLIISPDTLLIRLVAADPWTLLAWRGVLGAVTVMAYVALAERAEAVPRGWAAWAAVVSFAAGNVLFLYAATHTSVANTLFLVSTSPVFSALIARFFLGEEVGARVWATIGATLVGVAVIAAGSLESGGAGALGGDLAAVAAALSMAVSFSLARLRKGQSTVPSMGLGALLSGLVGLAVAPGLALAPGDLSSVLVMSLFVVPVAFICLTIGPRHIPAADVGLILLLEAILGPVLVWAVLGEDPGPHTLIGGAIILAALALSNLWVIWRGQARA